MDEQAASVVSGASSTFPQPATKMVGDKPYRLAPRILENYAQAERRILAKRPDPIPEVLRQIRQAKRDLLVERRRAEAEIAGGEEPDAELLDLLAWDVEAERAMLHQAVEAAKASRIVTVGEYGDWVDSFEGTAYLLWDAIRRNPENSEPPTEDEVLRAVLDDWEAKVRELVLHGLPDEEAQAEARRDVLGDCHDAMAKASGSDDRGN